MTIQQLSVFIENKSGTLQRVLNLLKEAGIQLIASTIADTVEYGIYRIICSEPKRAYETLKEAGISVALSDVFAITLDNQPGRAADAIILWGLQKPKSLWCGSLREGGDSYEVYAICVSFTSVRAVGAVSRM